MRSGISMDKSSERHLSRRGFLKSISFAALSTAFFSSFAKRAGADVPDILQIENVSQDSMGKVSLEIRHANPSTNHYVDIVEVDVEGQIMQFNLQPQDGNPFTVELELGEIQGKPNVKGRANCNLHGWSGWSDQIEIPELPIPVIVILSALATTMLMVRNTKK